MTRRTHRWWPILGALVAVVALASGGATAQGDKTAPCAPNLSACSLGCANPGTPDALVHKIKRTVPKGGKAVRLTLEDLFSLQDQATAAVGQKVDLDENARMKLQGLTLQSTNNSISEGNLVEITGYLTGLPNRPKASGPESVNCRLTGPANNDYHIPVVSEPDATEFEGIVVEMIPQDRNNKWTLSKLRRVAKEQRPVVVRGKLFYDNKHRVNDDPDEVLGGEPKRASLWEIHPVTELFVCMAANKKCNSQNVNVQQWVRLEQLKD